MRRLILLATGVLICLPAQPAWAQQPQVAPGEVSGRYKVSGAPAIRPSLIWDDGQKTFLDWPENIEAPAIFAIDAAGNESLVNSYYRDGRFVIDAVYSRLLFRLDRLTARADRKVGRS
jgi:type IV secretion system protein VirB9